MEKDELKKLQEKHRKEAQEIRAGIKAILEEKKWCRKRQIWMKKNY